MRSKTRQILILAIIAAAAAGVVVAINPSGAIAVQANQGGRSSIQRWEYCAITSAGYVGSNFGARASATIRYFLSVGMREEIVEFVPDLGKSVSFEGKEALAKAIAKLGDEGWEMVSKESDPDNGGFRPFYFKRPKQ